MIYKIILKTLDLLRLICTLFLLILGVLILGYCSIQLFNILPKETLLKAFGFLGGMFVIGVLLELLESPMEDLIWKIK